MGSSSWLVGARSIIVVMVNIAIAIATVVVIVVVEIVGRCGVTVWNSRER